jgi:hypothetical protein
MTLSWVQRTARRKRGSCSFPHIIGSALVAIAATSARAQPRVCDVLPSTPDTVDAVIYGSLAVLSPESSPPSSYRARVLEGLRQALVLPTHVNTLVFQIVRVDPEEMRTLGPMAARGVVLAGSRRVTR